MQITDAMILELEDYFRSENLGYRTVNKKDDFVSYTVTRDDFVADVWVDGENNTYNYKLVDGSEFSYLFDDKSDFYMSFTNSLTFNARFLPVAKMVADSFEKSVGRNSVFRKSKVSQKGEFLAVFMVLGSETEQILVKGVGDFYIASLLDVSRTNVNIVAEYSYRVDSEMNVELIPTLNWYIYNLPIAAKTHGVQVKRKGENQFKYRFSNGVIILADIVFTETTEVWYKILTVWKDGKELQLDLEDAYRYKDPLDLPNLYRSIMFLIEDGTEKKPIFADTVMEDRDGSGYNITNPFLVSRGTGDSLVESVESEAQEEGVLGFSEDRKDDSSTDVVMDDDNLSFGGLTDQAEEDTITADKTTNMMSEGEVSCSEETHEGIDGEQGLSDVVVDKMEGCTDTGLCTESESVAESMQETLVKQETVATEAEWEAEVAEQIDSENTGLWDDSGVLPTEFGDIVTREEGMSDLSSPEDGVKSECAIGGINVPNLGNDLVDAIFDEGDVDVEDFMGLDNSEGCLGDRVQESEGLAMKGANEIASSDFADGVYMGYEASDADQLDTYQKNKNLEGEVTMITNETRPVSTSINGESESNGMCDVNTNNGEEFRAIKIIDNGDIVALRFSFKDRILDIAWEKAKAFGVPEDILMLQDERVQKYGIRLTSEERKRHMFAQDVTVDENLCDSLLGSLFSE